MLCLAKWLHHYIWTGTNRKIHFKLSQKKMSRSFSNQQCWQRIEYAVMTMWCFIQKQLCPIIVLNKQLGRVHFKFQRLKWNRASIVKWQVFHVMSSNECSVQVMLEMISSIRGDSGDGRAHISYRKERSSGNNFTTLSAHLVLQLNSNVHGLHVSK